MGVLLLSFGVKLLSPRYTINLERKLSKISCGPVEGLPTLHRRVPGSNHGCSFTTL